MSDGVKLLIFLTGTFSSILATTYLFTSSDCLVPEATVISLFSAVTWILSNVSNTVPVGNSKVILPSVFGKTLTLAAFSIVL